MSRRLELHEIFCDILGSRNVYYQPPESVKNNYPAIVYSRNNIKTLHGDNSAYIQNCAYTVTLIDKNPDSEFIEKLIQFPLCKHQRNYKADNLNHDVL